VDVSDEVKHLMTMQRKFVEISPHFLEQLEIVRVRHLQRPVFRKTVIYFLKAPKEIENSKIFLHNLRREDRRKWLLIHSVIERKDFPAMIARRTF